MPLQNLVTRGRAVAALSLAALLLAPLSVQAVPVAPLVPVTVPPLPVQPGGLDIPPEAVPQEACQPDPLEIGLQKLRCRYGPLTVTPGTNLILVGPVTIEEPRAEGFMLSMTPNMIDAVTGNVPQIHEVHLHHGVWLEARSNGLSSIDVPFMAAGEEKTVSSPPVAFNGVSNRYEGYGYRVRATDEWLLNYMIHNQTAAAYETFITYDLDWINADSPLAAGLMPVKPVWWDTVGGFYPVYNPTTGPGAPDHVRRREFAVREDMELVWLAGHVHPGGKRIDLSIKSCTGVATSAGQPLFSSVAEPNIRPGTIDPGFYGDTYGSWDYRMTATKAPFRFTMRTGDRVYMDTVYDSRHPWYEAMGIVFGWGVPLDSLPAGYTPTPHCVPPPAELTTGKVTNVLPRDPIFGGTTQIFADPADQSVLGQPPVKEINIAAFEFLPGGSGAAPAPVKAGSQVTVRNLDFGISVYHSITSCADACNLNSGQRYPLPSWSYDSAQLGYGVPGVTAAKQSAVWSWSIPADAPIGATLPYFCRVHPFMRGSVQIVQGAA